MVGRGTLQFLKPRSGARSRIAGRIEGLLVCALAACAEFSSPAGGPTLTVLGESAHTIQAGGSIELRIKVGDGVGGVLANRFVVFLYEDHGGSSFSPHTALTDRDGVATTRWTPHPFARNHEASIWLMSEDQRARVAEHTLTATVVAGPLARIRMLDSGRVLVRDEPYEPRTLLTDTYGNPVTAPSLSWSSSDTAILQIDAPNRVVGRSPGVATATAQSGDVSASVPLYVDASRAQHFQVGSYLLAVADGGGRRLALARGVGNVTENPALLRWTSSGWISENGPAGIGSMYITQAGEAWAVATSAGELKLWNSQTPGDWRIHPFAGLGTSPVISGRAQHVYLLARPGSLWKLAGGEWTEVPLPASITEGNATLRLAVGDDDAFVAGSRTQSGNEVNFLLRWSPSAGWEEIGAGTWSDPISVMNGWGVPAVFVRSGVRMWNVRGTTLTEVAFPAGFTLGSSLHGTGVTADGGLVITGGLSGGLLVQGSSGWQHYWTKSPWNVGVPITAPPAFGAHNGDIVTGVGRFVSGGPAGGSVWEFAVATVTP